MSDFAELLLKEQNNQNVVLIEFFASSLGKTDIAVFVEGEDDPKFYYDFIKDKYPAHELRFFDCKNKNGVLEASKYLKAYDFGSPPYKMLFFCDSDFDVVNNKKLDDIITTKYYSIESYFADIEFLDYIIKKFGGATITPKQRASWLRETSRVISWMTIRMLSPMAAACYIRRKNYDFDFDKISINKLFNYDAKALSIKITSNRSKLFKELVSSEANYNCGEVFKIARSMRNLDYKYWVRGKLALQMIRLAARIANDISLSVPKGVASRICMMFGGEILAHGRSYLNHSDVL